MNKSHSASLEAFRSVVMQPPLLTVMLIARRFYTRWVSPPLMKGAQPGRAQDAQSAATVFNTTNAMKERRSVKLILTYRSDIGRGFNHNSHRANCSHTALFWV